MPLVVYRFAFSYLFAMKHLMFIFLFLVVVACSEKDGSKKPTQTISTTEERNVEFSTPAEENVPTVPPEETVIIIADPEPLPEVTPEIKEETELPIVITIADPEQLPPDEVPEYDYSQLSDLGIHIEGKSILSELNYPAAIYCSNTKHLNSEKIRELKFFMSQLKSEYMLCMDAVEIKTSVLIGLIKKSILELENAPQSRFCPQIYLAIKTDET